MKVSSDKEIFTTVDLIEGLTDSIFAELEEGFEKDEYSLREPAITSLRRNLQRSYLQRLTKMAIARNGAPQDCQTVAFSELTDLKSQIDTTLEDSSEVLDRYTRAHLQESSARIAKVLDARFMGTP